jgi:hypothetical protein
MTVPSPHPLDSHQSAVQLIITMVALVFNLLLFAILVCWVVLTCAYVIKLARCPSKHTFGWLHYNSFWISFEALSQMWQPSHGGFPAEQYPSVLSDNLLVSMHHLRKVTRALQKSCAACRFVEDWWFETYCICLRFAECCTQIIMSLSNNVPTKYLLFASLLVDGTLSQICLHNKPYNSFTLNVTTFYCMFYTPCANIIH